MKAEANPNSIVYFNNQYVALRDAQVSILTHALHYGTGVFEGIRGYWDEAQQELFLMRPLDHYQRWKRNCGILRIEVPASAAMLCDLTLDLIPRNQFRTNIYIRTDAKSLLNVEASIPRYEARYLWGIRFSTWGLLFNNWRNFSSAVKHCNSTTRSKTPFKAKEVAFSISLCIPGNSVINSCICW